MARHKEGTEPTIITFNSYKEHRVMMEKLMEVKKCGGTTDLIRKLIEEAYATQCAPTANISVTEDKNKIAETFTIDYLSINSKIRPKDNSERKKAHIQWIGRNPNTIVLFPNKTPEDIYLEMESIRGVKQ